MAVLDEQPVPAASARDDTALPTSQTDDKKTKPARRKPSAKPAAPAAPAGPPCTISSQTWEHAPDGTADTRIVVGVNESVQLTATAPSAWSATAGNIFASATASPSASWVSPASSATAVSCSITATPATGSPCSISFQVIPPRERKMTRMTDHAYTAGRSGSGFMATALVLPLNVSFGSIEVREETVAASAGGYYENVLHWDKGMHPVGKWVSVDATNNNIKDEIGTKPPGETGPFSFGTFVWPIPLSWRHPNAPTTTFPFGPAVQMQLMMDNSGTEITTKEGATRSRTP